MKRKDSPNRGEVWTDTEREAVNRTLAGIDSALLNLSTAAAGRALPVSIRHVANAEGYLLIAADDLRGCVTSAVARLFEDEYPLAGVN